MIKYIIKKSIDSIPSTRHRNPISSKKLIGLNEISYLRVGYNLVSCSEFSHRIKAEYLS